MKVIESHATYKLQTTKLPVNLINNEIRELKVVTETNIFLGGYEFLRNKEGNIAKFLRFKEDETRNLVTETCYVIFNRGEGIAIYSLKKTKKPKKGYLYINGENYKLQKKSKPHVFNSIKYTEEELIYETNPEINNPVDVVIKKIVESDNYVLYEKQIESIYSLILDKQLRYNFFVERREGELFTLYICFLTCGDDLFVIIKKYNYFSVSTILLFEYTFMQKESKKILQLLQDIEFPMNNSLVLEFINSEVISNENVINPMIEDYIGTPIQTDNTPHIFKETKSNTINLKIDYNILCDIIDCILLEKKLILVSKSRNRLFNFVTFLLNLIKPFEYSFYILNASQENLEDFLEIPFPYILLITGRLKPTNQFVYYLDLHEFDKPKKYKNSLPDLKYLKKKLRNQVSLKTIFSNYINILINNLNIKQEKFYIKFMLPTCKNQTTKTIHKNKSLDSFLIEFSKTRIYLSFFKNRNKLNIKTYPLKFRIQNQTLTPYFLFDFNFTYSIEIEKIVLLHFPSKTNAYYQRVKHSPTLLSEIFPFIVNNLDDLEAKKLFNFLIREGIFFPPESLRLIGDNKNRTDYFLDLKDYKIYLKKVNETFKGEDILVEKIFVEFQNEILHEFKIIDQKYFLFLSSDEGVFKRFVEEYEIFKWNLVLFLCFFREFNKVEFQGLPKLELGPR